MRSKDSVYYVKFLSAEDSSPIPYAPVQVTLQGVNIANSGTDIDSILKFKKKQVFFDSKVKVSMEYGI
jgi:hypothetical protein